MDRKGRNKQGKNPWHQAQHVWLYTDLLQALKGTRLSSVFSPDGLFICLLVGALSPVNHKGLHQG